MGIFLNDKALITNHRKMTENSCFDDKSDFISELIRNSYVNQYICITRPRRFGNTVNANMLAALLIKIPTAVIYLDS